MLLLFENVQRLSPAVLAVSALTLVLWLEVNHCWAWFGYICLLLSWFVVWRKNGVKIALVAIGLSVILLADYHIREQVVDSDVANWSESRLVVVKAIVEDVGGDADSSKRRLSLKALELLYPKQERLCGSLIAFEHGTSPALSKGDLIEIGLKPRMTRQCRYPFQFDYASYLRQRRISMNAFVVKDSVKVLTLAKDRQRSIFEAVFEQFVLTVDCLRERLVSLHRKSLGDEQGLLLSSMVLGNRNVDLPEELNKNFRITGLSHILAASGFNLSIVAFISYGLACFICRRIGLMSSSAYAYGFCFLAMCVFVIFAGPSPSVLRAFLMCSLVLIAKASFKTIRLGDSLALALLLCLAIEPLWVNDISLQFSFLSCLGIICGAGLCSQNVSPVDANTSRVKRIYHKSTSFMREAVLVCLCAQALIFPLQVYYFWQFALLFLPANIFVAPLIPLITIVGFMSSLLAMPALSWLNSIAYGLDYCISFMLAYICKLVDFFAAMDWSVLLTGCPSVVFVVIYYFALFALYYVFLVCKSLMLKSFFLIIYVVAVLGILFPLPMVEPVEAKLSKSYVRIYPDHSADVSGNSNDFEVQRMLRYYAVPLNKIRLQETKQRRFRAGR